MSYTFTPKVIALLCLLGLVAAVVFGLGFLSVAAQTNTGLIAFLPYIGSQGNAPAPTPNATASPEPTPTNPGPTPSGESYFSTLPPGSNLPSGVDCAGLVKPRPENKSFNQDYNTTTGGQGIASDFFPIGASDPRANTEIGVRVDGEFTGTTDEILQWAACKWGVDEDMVRAQAAIESWWHQDAKGDWGGDPDKCPPGHGLGVDGVPGQCPESWGILQNRYPYEQSAWPGMADSTAFNADLTYAIWRVCYEGYEWWLNDVERGWVV
jgi:autotransporter family porin